MGSRRVIFFCDALRFFVVTKIGYYIQYIWTVTRQTQANIVTWTRWDYTYQEYINASDCAEAVISIGMKNCLFEGASTMGYGKPTDGGRPPQLVALHSRFFPVLFHNKGLEILHLFRGKVLLVFNPGKRDALCVDVPCLSRKPNVQTGVNSGLILEWGAKHCIGYGQFQNLQEAISFIKLKSFACVAMTVQFLTKLLSWMGNYEIVP